MALPLGLCSRAVHLMSQKYILRGLTTQVGTVAWHNGPMEGYTISFFRDREHGREAGALLTVHAADNQAAIGYVEAAFPEGLPGFDALSDLAGKVIWAKALD